MRQGIGFALLALIVVMAAGCATTQKSSVGTQVAGSAAVDQGVVNEMLARNRSIAGRAIAMTPTQRVASRAKAFASVNSYCNLVWDHDENGYSVMRATAYTTVNVNNVRNGRGVGGLVFTLNAGDFLSLLQNNDGLNYDGYNC